MNLTEILLITILFLSIINIVISFLNRSGNNNEDIKTKMIRLNSDISKIDPLIRTEFSGTREENQKNSKDARQELGETLNTFSIQFTTNLKDNRTELNNSLRSFEEKFSLNIRDFNDLQRNKFNDLFTRQEQIKLDTETKLDKIRETLETRITSLQDENMKKLEEMRNLSLIHI